MTLRERMELASYTRKRDEAMRMAQGLQPSSVPLWVMFLIAVLSLGMQLFTYWHML